MGIGGAKQIKTNKKIGEKINAQYIEKHLEFTFSEREREVEGRAL